MTLQPFCLINVLTFTYGMRTYRYVFHIYRAISGRDSYTSAAFTSGGRAVACLNSDVITLAKNWHWLHSSFVGEKDLFNDT